MLYFNDLHNSFDYGYFPMEMCILHNIDDFYEEIVRKSNLNRQSLKNNLHFREYGTCKNVQCE